MSSWDIFGTFFDTAWLNHVQRVWHATVYKKKMYVWIYSLISFIWSIHFKPSNIFYLFKQMLLFTLCLNKWINIWKNITFVHSRFIIKLFLKERASFAWLWFNRAPKSKEVLLFLNMIGFIPSFYWKTTIWNITPLDLQAYSWS